MEAEDIRSGMDCVGCAIGCLRDEGSRVRGAGEIPVYLVKGLRIIFKKAGEYV